MPAENNFSFVICCYNSGKYIENCLNSVIKQVSDNDEIILVDDGSTDDSADKAEKLFIASKSFKIKKNITNRGLAFSRNTGWKTAIKKFVFYIDSDTVLPDGMRNTASEIISKYPDCSVFTGQGIEKNIRTIYDEWRAEFFSQGQGKKIIFIPRYLSGLCMIIRRDVLDKTGGFDENLFSHAEDVDFAYKLKNAKINFSYNPDIFVYHFRTDTFASLKKMIFNHIYWSCAVHKKNGHAYFLKYLFATLKIFFKFNVISIFKLRFDFFKINAACFYLRLKALTQSIKFNLNLIFFDILH